MQKYSCNKCGTELIMVPYDQEPGKLKVIRNLVGLAFSETWESGQTGLDRYRCTKCGTKYLDKLGNLIECSK